MGYIRVLFHFPFQRCNDLIENDLMKRHSICLKNNNIEVFRYFTCIGIILLVFFLFYKFLFLVLNIHFNILYTCFNVQNSQPCMLTNACFQTQRRGRGSTMGPQTIFLKRMIYFIFIILQNVMIQLFAQNSCV